MFPNKEPVGMLLMKKKSYWFLPNAAKVAIVQTAILSKFLLLTTSQRVIILGNENKKSLAINNHTSYKQRDTLHTLY